MSEHVVAATPFTTTTMPNPMTAGNMTVIKLSADNPVLAIALAGDAFPRLLIPSDATDAGFYFGDGTFDLFNAGPAAFIGYSSPGTVGIGASVTVNGVTGLHTSGIAEVEVSSSGRGVILHSPNNTKYRITVDNAGVLTTTVVP